MAGLRAVLCGLGLVSDRQRTERVVVLFSSSQYVVGILARNWRARANPGLVAQVRDLARGLGDLRVVWISSPDPGPFAKRARELARAAARREDVAASEAPLAKARGMSLSPVAPPRADSQPGVGEQLALWSEPDPVEQVLAAREQWNPERDEVERESSVCSEDRTTADYVDGWNNALDVHALPLAWRLRHLLPLARRLQEGLVEATGYLARIERAIGAVGRQVAPGERLELLRRLAHETLEAARPGEGQTP